MKHLSLSTLVCAGTALSSCIYYTDPVPEMPYGAYRPNPTSAQAHAQAYAAATQAEGTWYTTNPNPAYATGTYQPAPIPTPTATTPQPAPQMLVSPAPVTKPSSAITQAPLKLNPVTPKPAAAAKPAATAKPATTAAPATPKPATAPQDPKDITNKGPIPVATPVPGDPTRVYNPLDSNKTIRITDKNGKIYPSGKELKVRGTNFHFYVP